MAIVRVEGGGVSRRVGLKAAAKGAAKKAAKKGTKKGAKKGAKHAVEKHVAKHSAKYAIEKHAAKKHADKHAGKKAARHTPEPSNDGRSKDADSDTGSGKLTKAFHHMQRAAAVISLVEKESADLKALLDTGVALYQSASAKDAPGRLARQATPLLKAIEHLSLAGLYSARHDFRIDAPEPNAGKTGKRLRDLRPRLEDLGVPDSEDAQNLLGLAWELLRRADAAGDDAQLEWELAMAADGLCETLEEGF